MLINVAKNVYEKNKDWRWDIYGEGSCRETIQKDIDANGLHDFITLMGNKNLQGVYSNYSFLVSTSYYEGLPLGLLEAQEAKLPIISFDCPTGPSEIIENNENGFLIPAYNTDEMSKQILKLMEEEKTRKKFSNNSQKNIENFSKENIIKKWKEIIDTI